MYMYISYLSIVHNLRKRDKFKNENRIIINFHFQHAFID